MATAIEVARRVRELLEGQGVAIFIERRGSRAFIRVRTMNAIGHRIELSKAVDEAGAEFYGMFLADLLAKEMRDEFAGHGPAAGDA